MYSQPSGNTTDGRFGQQFGSHGISEVGAADKGDARRPEFQASRPGSTPHRRPTIFRNTRTLPDGYSFSEYDENQGRSSSFFRQVSALSQNAQFDVEQLLEPNVPMPEFVSARSLSVGSVLSVMSDVDDEPPDY